MVFVNTVTTATVLCNITPNDKNRTIYSQHLLDSAELNSLALSSQNSVAACWPRYSAARIEIKNFNLSI